MLFRSNDSVEQIIEKDESVAAVETKPVLSEEKTAPKQESGKTAKAAANSSHNNQSPFDIHPIASPATSASSITSSVGSCASLLARCV